MKTPYTFSILRYIHDVVPGEFVNVGVALYAPDARFLDITCVGTYGRVSQFFGGIDGDHFKRMLRHLTSRIKELKEQTDTEFAFRQPVDIRGWTDEILPADDSSLQFSPPKGGLTDDPQATLEKLYERYVERYAQPGHLQSRSDEEVERVFRDVLARRRVLGGLRPKKIVGADYEHEFPYSWKNGIWHTSEAVSFDLVEPGSIIEKANRWLGRAVNLDGSEENFKVYLLLGKPNRSELKEAFSRAENILHKMPCEHDFFLEDDAESFADFVREELAHHNKGQ